MIKAYATKEAKGKLEAFEFDPGALSATEVEVQIEYCGICHSDVSMINNDWGNSSFPLVPGHEVVGTITQVGSQVAHLKAGQKVGIGWFAGSCMTCPNCMGGDHNLCPDSEQTIVSRHGGFADKIRAHAEWVFPMPEALDFAKAGPLFCGGITVFNPFVINDIKPTDRVGVIGIGGLGHLALQFANAWGCEVTAFSSSPDKEAEAKEMGAHHFVASRDPKEVEKIAATLDMILVTINVPLDWEPYIAALRVKGKLHFVGAAPEVSSAIFPLLAGQKSIGASPPGSPSTVGKMLEFCARHGIEAVTEEYPMSQVNAALDHLRDGKARYRVVLKNDF
jgi:uncharacterized zinc-type alcohol dehydrogenase-like protein